MKLIYRIFSSTILMAILFVVFALSMIIATFVENDYGTEAARALFYGAKWFELILLLGVVNIILAIIRYKIYKKPTVFLFHLSFIVIILGAGITRYLGFEGTMHIREGQTSSRVLTDKTYVNISIDNFGDMKTISKEVSYSPLSKTGFHETMQAGDDQFEFDFSGFIQHARPTAVPAKNGAPVIELIEGTETGRNYVIIELYKKKVIGDLVFNFKQAYFEKHMKKTVWLRMENNKIYFWAPFPVQRTNMMQGTDTILAEKQMHEFLPMQLHNFEGNKVVLDRYFESGIPDAVKSEDENLPDAVKINVKHKDGETTLIAYGRKGEIGKINTILSPDLAIHINYGSNVVTLPFSLKLDDFIIDRYPGSNSPSWYESKVRLIDTMKRVDKEYRIYMNHILKHRGFRFYQSSYDPDEKGTILSVNYDMAGTYVTYAGYFLMAIGMFLSLFSKKSRFRNILSNLQTAKVIVFVLFILLPMQAFSRETQKTLNKYTVPEKQAGKFGKLAVQDVNGRIKPVNTLASEVLRKISRKETYKGLTADQVFLGMMIYPEHWRKEPLIKVSHKSINQMLGKQGDHLAFNDFFSDSLLSNYLLYNAVNAAHQKKPAYRTKADNELIRLDERISICYMVFTTRLLRIFPNKEDTTNRWYSPVTAINSYSDADSAFTENVIAYYAELVHNANKTGNWKEADFIVDKISQYQKKFGASIMPSEKKLSIEILYNKANIFNRISNYYLLFGLLLFILLLVALFTTYKLKIPVLILSLLIILIFGLHTIGLGLRWYISGHAPWSDGYESLIYISWAIVLAGIIFSRISVLTISLTAILASFLLTTAHLSWMDPQITLLVPVLKSYWLNIHVAIIAASYGFMALGALMAFLNLFFMFFETSKNTGKLRPNISLLSGIIELTLTVGLYMLTIGTFLGGIWANESWGRYWGWDAKETWALISVIAYAFILHMRLLPARMKGEVAFNSLAIFGFFFIIMTYFGVNYYLSGLHSYAAGDPLPVPLFVYFVSGTWLLLTIFAYFNQYQLRKNNQAV